MSAGAAARIGQRRHVALLFCDLCDSTGLSGTLEPEQFAAVLERVRALYGAVIGRHGGLIVRIDGDGLLAAFGYPEACDDAARRATEAALDLHQGAAGLGPVGPRQDGGVALHSGIHAGTVLVRQGDRVRGQIELLGEATNIAARLCDVAGQGEILVSAASLGGDLHLFESGAAPALAVAGRGEAVAVRRVTGRAAVANRFDARVRRGTAPFAGRVDALTLLRQRRGAAARGAVRAVLVWGETGIGKSRLLSEAAAEAAADGIAVHHGYCEAYLGAGALQPFVQIAQSALGRSDSAEAVSHLLRWAGSAGRAPAVLMIDDWQWADDASEALLAALLQTKGPGLLIVLASRPEGAERARELAIEPVELGPLDRAEADAVITALLGPADPFRIERIRDLAGGCPLYLEELCHSSGADLPGPGQAAGAGADGWLDALVQSRFHRLAPDQADLLRVAAVIGHMVPEPLFCAVAGIAPDSARLKPLRDGDFLHRADQHGVLRFKHALTRDAIYRTIGLDQRVALHGRVAAALESTAGAAGGPPPVDALAYHHAACGNADRAIGYALEAGDLAMAAGALDRAQAQFRLGLDQLGPQGAGSDRHRSLVGRFGRAAMVDPAPEQLAVLDAAARAARAAGDDEGELLAEYWLGSIHYGLGNAAESIAHLEAAQARLDAAARPGFAAQLLGNLGQSHAIASNFAAAEALLGQAIAAKPPAKEDSAPATGLAYCYATRGFVRAVQGHFPAAHADFDAGMAALSGYFHPMIASAQSLRALALIYEHRHEDSLAPIAEAVAASLRARARFLATSCRAVQDYVLWVREGDPRRVEDMISRAGWLARAATRQRLSIHFGWLTECLAALGDAQGAARYYAAACERAAAGDRLGEGAACRAMARLAQSHGAAHSPAYYLDQAYASARMRQAPRETFETDLCAADIYAAEAETDRAATCRARARAGFQGLGMAHRLAALDAACG